MHDRIAHKIERQGVAKIYALDCNELHGLWKCEVQVRSR